MKQLLSLFRKSIPAILLIIVLLIAQAQGDLALPDYISNIVNVGIQQGGIGHVTPLEIRSTELERLCLFLTEEEANQLRAAYQQNPDDPDTLLLTETDLADLEALDTITGLPVVAVYALEGGFSQEEASSLDLSSQGEFTLLDPATLDAETQAVLAQLPEDATFFDVMEVLPQNARTRVIGQIQDAFAGYTDLGEDTITQMGINWVRAEYEAIGLNTRQIQQKYILITGGKMLLFAALIALSSILVTLLASRVGAKFSADLRESVFHKVVGFSNKEYETFSTASLITRCTNDIQQVQMLITMLLRMVLYAPIIGFGALFRVMGKYNGMTWVIGLAVGLILVLILFLLVVAMPKFKIMQSLVDRMNLVSREILTGILVIRAFSREKEEEKRFNKANTDLMETQLFVNRIMACMMPAMMLIMNGICILIIWVGAKGIEAGTMQVGSLMAVIQYTMQIIMSFLMLSMTSIMLPRAMVSMRRVADVLETENTVLDPQNPVASQPDKTGVVEFRDVSFRYPGSDGDVLKHLSFTAKPGQTTAIIGATGSGKSTLLNLIPRFYDVTGGAILVDGVDVREIKKFDLRDKIGYVPQKGQLFTGTISSNIAYGMEKPETARIQKAAEIAQATEFIQAKSDGYDAHISQGGTNVSGGQRQRLSIARAIAKDPEIYLFDDSFSALDFKTDAALRKALWQEAGHRTILVVAQRVSTVLHADQILVLDHGEIAGKGTHKELMESCPVYQEIALSQLSREEMDA